MKRWLLIAILLTISLMLEVTPKNWTPNCRDGTENRVKSVIGGVTTGNVGNHFEWTGNTSTMVKYYYASSQRVAMRQGSSTLYFLLGDHLGSTSLTVNSSGGKVAELRPPVL